MILDISMSTPKAAVTTLQMNTSTTSSDTSPSTASLSSAVITSATTTDNNITLESSSVGIVITLATNKGLPSPTGTTDTTHSKFMSEAAGVITYDTLTGHTTPSSTPSTGPEGNNTIGQTNTDHNVPTIGVSTYKVTTVQTTDVSTSHVNTVTPDGRSSEIWWPLFTVLATLLLLTIFAVGGVILIRHHKRR